MTRARRPTLWLEDDEWYRPDMKNAREMCCDCGLVHDVDYRVRRGRVEIRARQNPQSTANARRMFGFKERQKRR